MLYVSHQRKLKLTHSLISHVGHDLCRQYFHYFI